MWGVNMPTVNCSAFTASNVGRLLRGDCRYWTVVFEVWSPWSSHGWQVSLFMLFSISGIDVIYCGRFRFDSMRANRPRCDSDPKIVRSLFLSCLRMSAVVFQGQKWRFPSPVLSVTITENGVHLTADSTVASDQLNKPHCKQQSVTEPMLPPCRICSEKASGFHYGANTCEACKVFV